MHPPTPAASTFAKATVDESVDKQAAARNPPSPRLRRIKGGDEAAGGEESRVEGQRLIPVAERQFVQGTEMR